MSCFDSFHRSVFGDQPSREMDAERFLSGHTAPAASLVPCHSVYGAYFAWCSLQKLEPLSPNEFDVMMHRRGNRKSLGYPDPAYIDIALTRLPTALDARRAA